MTHKEYFNSLPNGMRGKLSKAFLAEQDAAKAIKQGKTAIAKRHTTRAQKLRQEVYAAYPLPEALQ